MTHEIKGRRVAYLHDSVAVDKTIATKTRELYVDTVTEGPWAGITIGEETTHG